MLSKELQAMKARSHKTNKQIAEETGISESTVAKILNGESENPTWLNVIDIIKCLNGSADVVAGIDHDDESVSKSLIRQYEARIIREQEMHAENLRREQQHTDYANKRARLCSIAFVALFVLLVVILAADILNGGFGYIQY